MTFFGLFGEETNPVISIEVLEETLGVKAEDFFSEFELSEEFKEEIGAIWTIKDVRETLKHLDDSQVLLASARETAQAIRWIEKRQQLTGCGANATLSVNETAAVLGFNRSHVYRLMKFKKLSFLPGNGKGIAIRIQPSLEIIAKEHDVFICITGALCEELYNRAELVHMTNVGIYYYPHFAAFDIDTGTAQILS